MGRPCRSCSSDNATEINRKLRAGTTNKDISRWLTEIDDPITEDAIGRHARDHVGVEKPKGRQPPSGDFLRTVVNRVHEKVENDELTLTVRDGISAQAELNRQSEKMADRDLMVKIALALTGNVELLGEARWVDPEIDAIEGEYRKLLNSGEDPE